jgi:hypothetical protein
MRGSRRQRARVEGGDHAKRAIEGQSFGISISRGVGIQEESMTHRFSLIVLLWLLLMSPRLAASEEPRYPVLDSKVPVDEQTHPVWLNNKQVLFMGYDLDSANPPKQVDLTWVIPRGVYTWDLDKGTAARDHSWDGTTKWCVSGVFRSFLRLRPGTEKTYELLQGKAGEEKVQPYPEKHWFNNNSCHYYTAKPEWADERRVRRTLLEEHGYLDFGPWVHADRSDTARILLYRPYEKEPLTLPLNPNHVLNLFEYVAFENSYLLRGKATTPDAVPLWLLRPDGTVTQPLDPKGRAWERIGWTGYVWTKKEAFLISRTADGYAAAGKSGGYLLGRDNPERLIVGLLDNVTVSPDGCRIAFVHVLNSQVGADSIKALRAGKPGSRTLKIIDVCKGD